MQAERDLNWEDGTDVCNQVPQVMSYAEMSDIASLFLPKPYMILSGTRDRIFPILGVRQISSMIKHNYELAGVPERFRFVEFDEEHGYQLSLRQAAYGWLERWLFGKRDGSPIPEPVLDLLHDPYPVEYSTPPTPTPDQIHGQSPTLTPMPGALPGFCFPPHQVVHSEAVINAIIRVTAEGIPEFSHLPARSADLSGWQEEIKRHIQATLGSFPQKSPLRTRLFNQVWEDGLMAERINFQSEAGITIPGLFIMPEEWNHPVPFVIYAGEWGKIQGIHSGLIEELVQAGYGVLAIDVRGIGETATTDFEAATDLLMMDRPLFGQRVLDVIRAVDFVWERCYIAPQIDKGRLVVVGEGVGGLWGLYAAALDGRVAAVAAQDTLYSYSALLKHGAHYPASVYLFDVLNHFDLAQVIASCAPRPVYLRPVDGRRQPCTEREVAAALRPAREAFTLAGVGSNWFKVATLKNMQSIPVWLDTVINLKKK
jgi:dienelactone hydrolase